MHDRNEVDPQVQAVEGCAVGALAEVALSMLKAREKNRPGG
ncbi:hypothetical protein ACWD4B_12525 [Streptomyces sp. NPDC002536]